MTECQVHCSLKVHEYKCVYVNCCLLKQLLAALSAGLFKVFVAV